MARRTAPITLPQCLLALVLAFGPAAAQAQRLIELYRQALDSNPTVRSARFSTDQAAAQQDIALSRLLPTVSASTSYSWNENRENGNVDPHYNSIRTSLQIQQPVVDLASYYKMQAARYGVAQSERVQAAERTTLAANLIDRYFTVLQAADEIANVGAEKEVVEGQRRRLRFMRERELVKVTDVYEVEAYYQGLLTRELESRHVYAVALARLQELTGVKVDQVPSLVRENFEPVPGTDDAWVREATLGNPTLEALRSAIDAAELELQSSRMEHAPRVALTLSRVHSDQGFDNKLVPTYTIDSVGVQLTIPLYEGGRIDAGARDARARLSAAREKYETALREVERDARTAYLTAATNHARIASTGDEVEALTQVVESQRRGNELGVTTVIDLLAAQKRLFKSRSDRQKARYDYIRDVATLRARAGRLADRELAEIDSWTEAPPQPAPPPPAETPPPGTPSGAIEQRVVIQKVQ